MLKQSRILAIAATALAMSIGMANVASAAASDAQPNGSPRHDGRFLGPPSHGKCA